jgi:uncharacterized membrane protein
MTWWMYAFASALAASATAILAKIGIKGVPSNLATALRTAVALVFAWGIVFATREHHALRDLEARSVLFRFSWYSPGLGLATVRRRGADLGDSAGWPRWRQNSAR